MRLLRKWKDNKVLRIAVIAVLAVLAAVSVVKGVQNAVMFSQDFQWDAAKAFAMRIDPYELSEHPEKAYDHAPLAEFYRMFTDRGLTQNMEANQFPSLLMLLLPMTLLGPVAAKIVWAALNILFTAGIIFLLRKTFFAGSDKWDYAVLALIMIAGTPYRNQLGVGQHTLFAFFFFMLAVYIDSRAPEKMSTTESVLMTVCLAVSYFKYTLTAPLALYFIYRKRIRPFAASVLIHVFLTAVAVLWLHKSFLYMITAPLRISSRLAAEGGIDIGVFLDGRVAAAVAVLIGAMLVFLAVRTDKGCDNLLFSILILWSLVITYHRTYDLFVFSAAAAYFVHDRAEDDVQGFEKVMYVWYMVLTATLYFVLRIFDENTASIIAAVILYYGYTIALTVRCLKTTCTKQAEEKGKAGKT